ncbi:MAG: DUF1800 family protein [Verrucomicrobiales bacterium]|nr:DUF1800 family protein [Verrucomicrobiales bacterium]
MKAASSLHHRIPARCFRILRLPNAARWKHAVASLPGVASEGFPKGMPGFRWLGWAAVLAWLLTAGMLRAQVAGAMDVWPRDNTVELGSAKQFGAYVPINPNTVVWLVNDLVGGNATLGTISASGLYTPPPVAPTNNVLTIRVRSTAFPSSSASTSLKVTRKYPWLWSVRPSGGSSIVVGAYRVGLNGSNFAPDSVVTANGLDLVTTYVSTTQLTAVGTAAAAGTLNFAVRQPGPGAVTGNSVGVSVVAGVVTVAVAPVSATVSIGTTKAFAATVNGTTNVAVTWSVNGVVGGSAATGVISSTGVYTAPSVLPASTAVTVRATSVASPTAFGQATVTLTAPLPAVTVTVSPATTSVVVGGTQAFVSTVTGSANTAVTWSVNGVNGGSAATGTISSTGLYTAPASLPATPTVTVRATSVANPAGFAQATVTLVPPPPPITVAVLPATATVSLGSSRSFAATVTGTNNTAVTWSVNGIAGGSAALGTITSSGVFTAPSVMPSSSLLTIRATSVANPAKSGTASASLALPATTPGELAAARFLEQSSFGPTRAEIARVRQMGFPAYLDEQFSLPATPIPVPPGNSVGELQQWLLSTYTTAPDQLRQRVIYSLGQIVVTSANKLVYADAMLPWMNALRTHAFGNYRDLLREVAMSSSMGKYLDLANSMKPGLGGGANENFPRELMQLFTIGLWELNPDGTVWLDPNGAPVPTYTQADVMQLALALTGWTYATAPGQTPRAANNEYHGAPMETRPSNHDTSAKNVLGRVIPANQTVPQDLESVLEILMTHPNLPPFLATRLIRSLVMSNPSPGYVQRVASVFSATGGDLRATVTAILTDAEARNDTPTATSGRLKEPILHISQFLRALDGRYSSTEQLTYLYDYMAQMPLSPPSVFSWFSPLYRVPKSPLFGPEFQIYSPTEATLRGNLLNYLLGNSGGDFTIDLSPYQPFGNDMPGLVEAVNQRLLYGRMPAGMKQVLITAATPGYDARTRIETVLYLTALSGQYAVQY